MKEEKETKGNGRSRTRLNGRVDGGSEEDGEGKEEREEGKRKEGRERRRGKGRVLPPSTVERVRGSTIERGRFARSWDVACAGAKRWRDAWWRRRNDPWVRREMEGNAGGLDAREERMGVAQWRGGGGAASHTGTKKLHSAVREVEVFPGG